MFSGVSQTTSLELKSYVSQEGLHGTITFTKVKNAIKITTNLNGTLEHLYQTWSWAVTEFPVDYSILENRCDPSKLGKTLINLDDIYGPLFIPDNATSEFITEDLTINGPNGLYGKSLFLRNLETRTRVCASITVVDKSIEKTAVAKFNSPVSGSVYFKWFSTKDNHQDMIITTDLYHVSNIEKAGRGDDFTEHSWKIYVTDILNHETDSTDSSCNILQLVFDPQDKGEGNAIGDVDKRLGKVKISKDYKRNQYKTLFRDEELILLPSDLTGPQRRLYLVIFETTHEDSFLACAKIRYEHPVSAK